MNKKYTGVSYNSDTHQCASILRHQGKVYRCGFYETEKEGAIARDKVIIQNGLKVKLQVLKPAKKQKSNDRN